MKRCLARSCVVICLALANASSSRGDLIHRWSFSETGGAGTILNDSVGTAHAMIIDVGANNADVGTSYAGQVHMAGGAQASSDYVKIPGIAFTSVLGDATIELWATQRSVQNWSRIIDIGSSQTDFLLMSWTQGTTLTTEQVRWYDSGVAAGDNDNNGSNTLQPFTLGTQFHIVLTIEVGGAGTKTIVRWYKDGVYKGTFDTYNKLSDLSDTWCTLGRSKWADNTANASYNELRIYDCALSPAQIAENTARGPDAPPVFNTAVSLSHTTDATLGGTLVATNGPTFVWAYWGGTNGGINKIEVPNALNYGYYQDAITTNITVDDGVANGLNGGLFLITPTIASNWVGEVWQAANYGDYYCKMWWGVFTPPLTGSYEFYVHGDDYEVLWIDKDRDGEFEQSAGELISSNRPPEGWSTPKTTTVTLDAGKRYLFAIAFNEGSGGDFINVTVKKPGGVAERINPGAVGQSGWWSAVGWQSAVALGQKAVGTLGATATGLSANARYYYYRYYASNATWQAWAPDVTAFTTPGAAEWVGPAGSRWGSTNSWSDYNVPDASGEVALFKGRAAGNAYFNGSNITVGALSLSSGNYTLLDTNATPGSLTVGVVTNTAGTNILAVTTAVSGAAKVSGGNLTLSAAPNFSASEVTLNGGTLTLRGAITEQTGLRGSILATVPQNENPVNLDGGSYQWSGTRVLTGNKADTILQRCDNPAYNVLATGALQNWGNFPGYTAGDNMVTAFSGRFYPRNTGTHTFRWSNDDRGLMFIDMNEDGRFDSGERIAAYAWDGTGTRWLNAGQGYTVLMMAHEFGGGQSVNYYITTPDFGERYINPSDAAQAGMWKTWTIADTSLSGAPIHAAGNAALATPGNVALGSALSVDAGATLNKVGGGTLELNGAVSLPAGSRLQHSAGTLRLPLATANSLGAGTLELSGGDLVVTGTVSHTYGRLAHRGYHTISDALNNLNGNGGLLVEMPYGETFLTVGPGSRGLDFNSDADFTGTGAVSLTDNYMNLFLGYFNAQESGNHEFRVNNDDDRSSIWLDLDQDGVFDAPNGLGTGENLAYESTTVATRYLTAGQRYRFAVTHGEITGGSTIRVLFKTPSMGAQTIIKPGDPTQTAFWSSAAASGALAMEDTALAVTGDSRLDVCSADAASLGALRVASGSTLTLGRISDTRTSAALSFNSAAVTGNLSIVAGTALALSGYTSPGANTVTIGSRAALAVDSPLTAGTVNVTANGVLTVNGAITAGTLIVPASGVLTVNGAITAATKMSFEPSRTITNVLSGAGDVWFGENRTGNGFILPLATNTYTGSTIIRRALLRAGINTGLPAASRLRFWSQGDDEFAMLETRGALSRNIGTAAGEVYWEDRGGFSALGGPLEVTLEGGAVLNWGDANTGFNGKYLQLNSSSADSAVTLKNGIDLNTSTRHLFSWDNTATKADVAILAGPIGGSGAAASTYLYKWRNGTVWLRGTNTYTQITFLDDGVLRADPGVGLPNTSHLVFDQNGATSHGVLEGKGLLARNLGPITEVGAVLFQQHGGFAAYGGPLTVTLEGGSRLSWTDANAGFNGKYLQLGSRNANNVATLTNPIDLTNATDWVWTFDNTDTTNDVAVLSGTLSGTNSLLHFWIGGDGLLALTGNNTFRQRLTIDDGATVRALDGVGLPTLSTLVFDGNNTALQTILETSGTFTRNVGPQTELGAVSWDRASGGFAAHGAPLDVLLEGGAQLTSQGSANTGFNTRALQLGSKTANDVVTFRNNILLTNDQMDVYVFENTLSANDRSVIAGSIGYYGWGDFCVLGNGVLELTAPTNTIRQVRIYNTATLLIEGYHNGTDYIYTEANQNGTLGGTGTALAWNYIDIRNGGILAPGGRDAAGTLKMEVVQAGAGNDLELQSGSTYAWHLGGLAADRVALTGNLRLTSGWKLKLLDGGGGMPVATNQYVLFTYTGTMNDFTQPTLDKSAMPAAWVTSGMSVVHDALGKRVYLTGLYSTLSIGNRQPSALTSTSAQLNGIVSSSGQVVQVWAYWGGIDGGTTPGAWSNAVYAGASTNELGAAVSCPIAGLRTNALYYYTFRATNATLNMWAMPSIGFHALGPPVVGNAGAIDVAAGSATLQGAFLDHNRGAVTVCWGTVDGGTGSTNAWQYAAAIGTPTAAAFAATVARVYYPLSYVYRCYAVNPYGSDWSDSATPFSVSAKPQTTYSRSGLMGRWTFDDSTCGDSSGNDYHGQKIGGAYSADVPGVLAGGKSVDLRGGDYFVKVDTGAGQSVFNLDELSVACWTKGWPDGTWEPFVSKQGEAGGWQLRKTADTANQINWTLRGLANGDWYGTSNINNGAWHHLTATYGNGYRRLYVNNVKIAEAIQMGVITDTADMLVFGARQNAGAFGGYARVQLDDILIYNRALEAGEVSQLFSNTVTTAVAVDNAKPTGVGLTTATLNGTVATPGCVYDVWVYWGETDRGTAAGAWEHPVKVGTITNYSGNVSRPISGLVSGHTYWYTFRLSNAVDSVWATPSRSVAPVSTPTVVNAPGAAVSVGEAALRGQLTAGAFADVRVYWGRTDGGTTPALWDDVILLTDIEQGVPFSTNVVAGYGVTYYYRCFASNEANTAWAASTTNFMTLAPPEEGWVYAGGLRGSIFTGITPRNETQLNLDDAYFTNSVSRVLVGGKANTILTLTAQSAYNVVVTGEVVNFNQFPGFVPVDDFVTAFSGKIYPRRTGRHAFRWSNDDAGLMYIDRNHDGRFVNGERVAAYAWDSTGYVALTNGVGGYDFMFMAHEHGGGESVNWYVTEPLANEARVNTTNQAPLWQYPTGIDTLLRLANDPVTDITTNSATMNGTLRAAGWVFDVYACWGTNDGANVFANWQHVTPMGSYTNFDGTLSLGLTNMLEGSNYWYTFIATNEVTNLCRASVHFTTKSRPTVVNLAATDMQPRSVTLNGDLTRGGYADVTVYWGLSDGGTNAASWDNTNAFGTVVVGAFGTNVSVWAGGRYYYRAYAANDLGTDWADTTAAFNAPKLREYYRTGLLGCHTSGNMYLDLANGGNLGVVRGPYGGRTAGEHWSQVIGPDNSTLMYTGQIYLDGGPVTFVKCVDDRTRLIVDGVLIMDDGNWQNTVHGTLTRVAGWYNIDLRFSNGSGGYGPVQQDGWTGSFGFGMDSEGRDDEEETHFVFPEDPGDRTLFRYYDTAWGGAVVEPDLANGALSGLGTNRVTLGGTLFASNWLFNVYALYGTNDAGTVYNNWQSRVFVGQYTNFNGALSQEITGLLSGTNYWCTFFATNGVTNVWAGAAVPFQTKSAPYVVNAAPTGVTLTSATLNGELVRGGTASVTHCWGLADGGTTLGAWAHADALGYRAPGSFSTNVAVRAGGRYWYRAQAVNDLGTDWADASASFLTPLAALSVVDGSAVEGDTGSPTIGITVALSALCASNVTVNYTTVSGTAVAGSDFAGASGTLTIPAGQPSGTIPITVLPDRLVETPSEAFSVVLSSPHHATIARATGVATLSDDDMDLVYEPWRYRMKVFFRNYTGATTLTNFPALVKLNQGISGFRYSDFTSAEGWDLRFMDSTESRGLNYEIEQWDPNGDSYVWVQLPTLAGTNTWIWAYWNNPDLLTTTPTEPLTVPGCVLWLKADGLALANGAAVSAWTNAAARVSIATQGTAGNRPTFVTNARNGKPAVRFDGNDDYLDFTSLNAQTVFFVCNVAAASAGLDGLLGYYNSDTGIRREGDTGWQHAGNGNDFSNPAGSTFRVNAVAGGTVAESIWHVGEAYRGTGTMAFNRIGGYYAGRFLAADISEVLVYDRPLTATEVNRIGYYLAQKYAVSTSYVPAGSPFVNPPSYAMDGSTWSQGYDAVWHFASNVGDSARRNTAAAIGNPVYTATSKVGPALQFDGTDDYVDASDGFADYTGGITVSAWTRPTAFPNWTRVIDFGSGSGVNNILLARPATTADLRFEFYGTAGGTEGTTLAAQFVQNQWQYFAATCAAGGANTATARIYRDGVQRWSATDFSPPPNVTRFNNYIGRSNWADALYAGQMDELRISRVARSADWLMAEYNAISAPETFGSFGALQVRQPSLFIFR